MRDHMDVYLLQHESENSDEPKLLGVFDSRESAESAIVSYRELPGFREFPEGFSVDKYEVNKKCWTEGFLTRNDQ